MAWPVAFGDQFDKEFEAFPAGVQDELLALAKLLREYGPQLCRPYADTLKGSAFMNMKELRFEAEKGVWRVAFAFDPERRAILLVAGDKVKLSSRRFYKNLIAKADQRYQSHLDQLAARKRRIDDGALSG